MDDINFLFIFYWGSLKLRKGERRQVTYTAPEIMQLAHLILEEMLNCNKGKTPGQDDKKFKTWFSLKVLAGEFNLFTDSSHPPIHSSIPSLLNLIASFLPRRHLQRVTWQLFPGIIPVAIQDTFSRVAVSHLKHHYQPCLQRRYIFQRWGLSLPGSVNNGSYIDCRCYPFTLKSPKHIQIRAVLVW